MVAQHIVTIPIFDCLFADSQFARRQPHVAVAINNLLLRLRPNRRHSHACGWRGDTRDGDLFEEELRPLTRAYRDHAHPCSTGALTPAAKVDVLQRGLRRVLPRQP